MMTNIITIKPEGIENIHKDLPFDLKRMFKSECPGRQVVPSSTRTRHFISIDGNMVGYVQTMDFAMEIIREKFSQEISRMFRENQVKQFQVKYEETETRRVCKLYQVSQGTFYNSRAKMMTIQIEAVPRLEFERKVNSPEQFQC